MNNEKTRKCKSCGHEICVYSENGEPNTRCVYCFALQDEDEDTMKKFEAYLGDAVYAHFDGYHIVLETGCNKIFLDHSVVNAFVRYAARLPDLIERDSKTQEMNEEENENV